MIDGSRQWSHGALKAPYTTPLEPLQINLFGELSIQVNLLGESHSVTKELEVVLELRKWLALAAAQGFAGPAWAFMSNTSCSPYSISGLYTTLVAPIENYANIPHVLHWNFRLWLSSRTARRLLQVIVYAYIYIYASMQDYNIGLQYWNILMCLCMP